MKELFFTISNGDSSATAELSGCIEWMKGDMDANFKDAKEGDDVPEYTLTPIWLTVDEYNNLPEAD